MNKITRKLFLYFTAVSVFLAVTVFFGFYGTFHHYTVHHHEAELHARAETIQHRLESFMNNCAGTQELGTYVKVLDDISLADAYFISRDGSSYTCTCSCNTTFTIEKEPPPQIRAYAEDIFLHGQYTQTQVTDSENYTLFYAGIPVRQNGETTAVVILVDTLDIDKSSFLFAIAILLVCLLTALILSAVLALFLSRRFMQPIHRIAFATKAMSIGNYQVKTDVHDQNEIGILANEVDSLAERLEDARRESEKLEQLQKDYIANISHELRTPITVIRSSLEAICDGMIDDQKLPEYQKQMLAESIALQRLINDMLELSRLQNKDFSMQKESLDLLMPLDDAVRATRLIAEEKQIRVLYQRPEEEWRFFGDYDRLRQMFIAALDNAINYSDPGKPIRITAQITDRRFCVSIQDEGCGIPEEQQPLIFNKFYRSSPQRCPGTGLGMTILKNIADRHGIDITLTSAPEKGTTITFRFPPAGK